MSKAYQNSPYQKEEANPTETVDDLMLREGEAEGDSEDRSRAASSVRDIASRIPESLSAIGRDISRTIERAISAKDDYVVAVKVSPAAQEKVGQLVAAGIFRNRAEAAGEIKKPFFADPMLDFLIKLGQAHEQAYLTHLTEQGLRIVEIPT